MKRLRMLFALLVCSLLFASSAHADRMTYQPGPDGTDVWITNTYDYGSDFGVDDDRLKAGGWGDEYRFLWKPDLTGLPSSATSVALWMFPYPRGDASTPVSMAVDLMTTPWNEDTGWYNTVMNGIPLGVLSAPTPGQWYGINITQIYNLWKAGTYANHGFRFRPTGINNQFSEFLSSDFWYGPYRPKMVVTYKGADLGFVLEKPRPQGFIGPMPLMSPYEAPISSVFDHAMSTPYSQNDPVVVIAYTGEKGDAARFSNTDNLTCVKQASGQAFVANGNYVGSSDCGGKFYLSYNGHSGIDYAVITGTPVYAAASGTIDGWGTSFDCPSNGASCSGYGRIGIRHPSGYSTWYLHLSKQVGGLQKGSSVTKGQLIGYTGQTSPTYIGQHLHFEVRKNDGSANGMPVDPYGWNGNYKDDPYYVLHGVINARLWD